MTRRNVILPTLHPGQVDVDADRSRFKLIVAGRRFGKTRYATRACLRVALGDRWWKPDDRSPGRAWWVAPIYKTTNEGWEPLVVMARQIPGSKIEIAERRIILPNGGRVEIRSADKPESLVGAGLDLVVLDEAGTMKPQAWYESIRPTLSDRIGGAIFIGTPKGYNWLWEEWEAVDRRSGWARFHRPSWANPLLDPAELDSAREELGSTLFAQEYGAEFVDLAGGMFQPEWIRWFSIGGDGDDVVYVTETGTIRAADCRRVVVIDPAVSTKTTADYTAIMAVAISRDGRLLVLDVDRRRMEGPDVVPAAARMLDRWDASLILVESVAFQLTLFQEARRSGLPVQRVKADRDKVSRALPLAARLEAGSVSFLRGAPWVDELRRELTAFPAGAHDDQVDALAYAAAEVGRARQWAAY